ncbi:casein kinase II subunit alpha'-interacting protein-like [Antechinus flavipes]|uniref:casein kinase II subunit alpha'-interacting protein-like n=1 Tax=Antechinus flavipes TaxID=38775 RepID=UPI0022362F80|nr:casein kinase II subunit alpha'-interacting protein-like [Antechinus flavipes]
MIDKDSIQSRLKFNQCFKSPDAKHCIIHPLRSKSHETETKLLPDYQVSLRKLLLDPEYRNKFLLNSKNDTEIPLSLSYQSNDELELDQNAKCLLTPSHHVKSAFDTDQQQIEDTIDSKAKVHFASDLNHKIKFRQGTDDCMKYELRPKQQDEISSDSDFLMKDKPDSSQEIKLPSKSTNWITFPLDTNPRDIPSQNSQTAPYSNLEQQSTPPLGNTQETSSPFLKQWLKPTQAPKYCTTHFTWPKHPNTPSSEFDFQQTSPLSFEQRQINTPIFGEQLESTRDSLSSAQGHSHLYHCAKAYPDKEGEAISIPKYQNQAINNRESSWCFNYIRPYIIKGGTVHNRTVNSIISSIPQKEIKNDIRKQILLKRMKESSNHRFGSHLCASYNVCVLCASWIPHGCPHVDKMQGQTIAQLLAIPTPMPGSNTRMGIKFILQLPPQRTSPDIYPPHTNFGVPHHTHSSTIPSSAHSEFTPHESPLFSLLGHNYARHQYSPRRKASRSPELLLGEMSRRKEESVESVGIFTPFLERYHMKRRGN